ncbi:MAG: DUF4129 domain-containing protein [Chloroflexaceae bacterium]|nr:DUF4129 domain-containing protein [Chloroflexaceae bacterium]
MQHRRGLLRWPIFLLLLVVLGSVAPATAQEVPPDVTTYEGWLREALAAARRGDQLGLEAVATNLIETETVVLNDDTRISVDNSWLAAALEPVAPDLPSIADRLGAVLDALIQVGQSAPNDAQQRLTDILSRPPFVEAEPTGNTWWTQFLDWLFDILDRLFRPVADAGAATGDLFGYVVMLICGVLLAGVIIYLLLNMRRSLVHEVRAVAVDDPEANLTATTALQQASTLARDGDYRTAVRYLYLSSLLWLDEQGRLRYDRALTNREYLDRLNSNPDLQARLVPIVNTFDRVWYGYAALDAESFSEYERQVAALRERR